MQRTKQRILSVIDATQERVRKGSNAAGCFSALRSEIEMLPNIASQWVSVEERLPEDETMVTAHSPNGRIDVLKYHDREFVDELGQAHCVDYFIPIPQLNPEKEER